MPKKELWIWLNAMPSITDTKINNLLDRFGDIEQIYKAQEKDYAGIPGLSPKDIAQLCNKSSEKANNIIRIIKSENVNVLTFDEDSYPDTLRQIYDLPHVLYIKGSFSDFNNNFMISVVGTRTNSQYGENITHQISTDLAIAGVVVVSGMARGIDTIAHSAAVAAGGKTIAVLGCGIDVVYPPENKDLMDAICINGAVISEFPPTTPPARYNFPKRNRIIAGLSSGTLVVEGSRSSGSLITAHLAMDYSRDVFAIPGNAGKYTSEGPNMLIREYAKLASSAKDILQEYPHIKLTPVSGNAPQPAQQENEPVKPVHAQPLPTVKITNIIDINSPKYAGLSQNEKAILELISNNHTNIDAILSASDFNSAEVNYILIMLELRGFISQTAGKNYEII